MRKSLALIFAILLVGTTVTGAALYALNIRETGNLHSRWPTTQGTILTSDVSSDFGDSGTWFFVRFTYEVNGRRYAAEQEWVRPWLTRTHQYPEGSSVTVYYNPVKPGEAVIEPREPSPNMDVIWVYLFAIALAAIIASILILSSAKGKPW